VLPHRLSVTEGRGGGVPSRMAAGGGRAEMHTSRAGPRSFLTGRMRSSPLKLSCHGEWGLVKFPCFYLKVRMILERHTNREVFMRVVGEGFFKIP
jgi:hypothetical protein